MIQTSRRKSERLSSKEGLFRQFYEQLEENCPTEKPLNPSMADLGFSFSWIGGLPFDAETENGPVHDQPHGFILKDEPPHPPGPGLGKSLFGVDGRLKQTIDDLKEEGVTETKLEKMIEREINKEMLTIEEKRSDELVSLSGNSRAKFDITQCDE